MERGIGLFRKTVSAIMLSLLIVSMLTLVFRIQIVRADGGTIYINADGSITPSTAPIYTADNVTYTLIGNITADTDGIVIERDNIVLDGAGYSVMGSGANGITLTDRSNVIINNITLDGFMACVWLDSSSNNTISANNITESDWGIYLNSSNYDSIIGNNITNVGDSIIVDYSSNTSISGNNITDSYGIWLKSSSNNSISENIGNGINLDSSNYNSIIGNAFINYGLYVQDSYHNSVENNTIDGRPLIYLEGVSNYTVENDAGQVVLVGCENITVEGLDLSIFSTELWGTSDSTISGNNITSNNWRGNAWGIILYSSSNNNYISGNNIANNDWGILFFSSSSNNISGNNITANNAVGVYADSSSNNSNISVNNITNNYEGIALGSTSNSISGNYIANNTYGILISSSNNSISGNNIINNVWGIQLEYSSGNTVSGNRIANNGFGIYFENCSPSNSISGNDITGNFEGIYLWACSNTSISGNNIANNGYGMILEASSSNSIFHNDFARNNIQIDSTDSVNIWDNGYPSGGNYWSDYKGTDSNHDGIGDTPYVIDVNNLDNYPLMSPWTHLVGDLNGNGKVDLADLVLLANAYGSKPGDSNWNPNADIAPSYGVIGLTDLVTLATHYGQHYP